MGLSGETYLFDVTWEESGRRMSKGMVLRAAPRGRQVFAEYELGHQFPIMQILKGTSVTLANVLWLEHDPTVFGSPFFIMEKLDGDVPQDYPSCHASGMYFEATREHRTKMWRGCLQATVDIHRLDWRSRGVSFLGVSRDRADALDRQLAYWEHYLNWIKDDLEESHPTMEASLAWLKGNRYEPERLALCWGNARIGNTLYS